MGDCLEYRKSIPVRHRVDVFVAGGGPAGAAAAVTAARQGARVYLAEGHSCLGGLGTAGMVPLFMQFKDGVNFLAGGIGEEIRQRLIESGGTGPDDDPDNPLGIIRIRAEALKRLYDDLLLEAGVDFTFHTSVIDAAVSSGRIEQAVCSAKSGLFAVEAGAYVDATGDGDLAVRAGAPFEKGSESGDLMGGTLCTLWAGIDWEEVRKSGISQSDRLEEAFRDGILTVEDRHLPGMFRVGERLGGGNIGHTYGVDGSDERSLTEGLLRGRKLAVEYERYYREYLRGYEAMELVASGSLLGIRESRRIMGDYVLGLKDFRERAVFDDEIGRYAYPVDIHEADARPESHSRFEKEFRELRYGKGESYGIPLRSLIPRNVENLLVAGRCISSDRYIQSSLRVMPGCYITGQAAGAAAALAAETNSGMRGIDGDELRRRLKAMGAYLPNA